MIQEDYCSYEIAKLLKEKGFNVFLPFGFNRFSHIKGPRKFIKDEGRGGYYDNKEDWISCPTHQMACKWLREEKDIFITIYCGRNVYNDEPYYRATYQRLDDEPMEYPIGVDNDYSVYETCVEAALRYCLGNLV